MRLMHYSLRINKDRWMFQHIISFLALARFDVLKFCANFAGVGLDGDGIQLRFVEFENHI
jgi:hypothetical protein